MPTKRTLRQRHRREELTPFQVAFLLDRPLPSEDTESTWWRLCEQHLGPTVPTSANSLWRANREQLLLEHIRTDPGTRPSTWWLVEAPEPRLRLGGVGMPRSEVLADIPTFWCGVPTRWLTRDDVTLYSGRAKDIHGVPIMADLQRRPFRGVAIDPQNPPLFESQAAYLRRHGLLLPGETKRLVPADFEPERILPELDEAPASGPGCVH